MYMNTFVQVYVNYIYLNMYMYVNVNIYLYVYMYIYIYIHINFGCYNKISIKIYVENESIVIFRV